MTQADLNRQLIAMGMMPLTEISPTPKAQKDLDKKTEPKQTLTPTAKAAGVLDSRERAAANSQVVSGLADMGAMLAAPTQTAKSTPPALRQTNTPTADAAGVLDSRERTATNSRVVSGLADMGAMLAAKSPAVDPVAKEDIQRLGM